LRDRILHIIKFTNTTQKEFAERIGITQSAISQFLKGQSKGLKSDTLLSIIKEFGINPTWLLTGEGEMFTTSHRGIEREEKSQEKNSEVINGTEVENKSNGLKTIKGGEKSPAPEDVTRENIHLTKLFNSLSKKKQIAFLLILEIQDEKFFEEAIGYLSYKLDQEKKARDGERQIISQKGEAG